MALGVRRADIRGFHCESAFTNQTEGHQRKMLGEHLRSLVSSCNVLSNDGRSVKLISDVAGGMRDLMAGSAAASVAVDGPEPTSHAADARAGRQSRPRGRFPA